MIKMCLKNDNAWKMWGFLISKKSIIKFFSYVKCYCDNIIVEGQCANDMDNEKKQIDV